MNFRLHFRTSKSTQVSTVSSFTVYFIVTETPIVKKTANTKPAPRDKKAQLNFSSAS